MKAEDHDEEKSNVYLNKSREQIATKSSGSECDSASQPNPWGSVEQHSDDGTVVHGSESYMTMTEAGMTDHIGSRPGREPIPSQVSSPECLAVVGSEGCEVRVKELHQCLGKKIELCS